MITRLLLKDFRSYAVLDLAVTGKLVALSGENGAGKTNLLEAISLLAPGRGLRRADTIEMARIGGTGLFSVSATWATDYGPIQLGTGLAAPDPEGRRARLYRIDGETQSSSVAFADYLRMVWLTPALDGLFSGPAGDRRRFLDRLVLAIDSGHGTRVSAFERALRSRNKLLEENFGASAWLDALEREAAELAIAIAAARAETVNRLDALILQERDETSPFPWGRLALEGEIDTLVALHPAVEAEELYRQSLREGRARDRAAGRTLSGPQASDLAVRHGPKDVAAELCSTGEQKALLIGLVLAHARLVQVMSGISPLVLLDEIAAHLDPRRRAGLFRELERLGSQVWMTGADPALFQELGDTAQIFSVAEGHVTLLS